MHFLLSIALVLQIISAVVVIVLVLMQHGKGADLGAAFGAGASGSLFGAAGSANFLSRSTAVAATIFFCSTLALTLASGAFSKRPAQPTGGVLSTVEQPVASQEQGTKPAEQPAETPSKEIPR
ncbi:MAG: Protein-export membrane protein SecG [Burkholderia sp.]|jgi:preprotein translocase subunit SecG